MKNFVSTAVITLVLIAFAATTVSSGTTPWFQRPLTESASNEDHPWGGDDSGGDGSAPVQPKGLRSVTHSILVDLYFRYSLGRSFGLYKLAHPRTVRQVQNTNLPSDYGTATDTQSGSGSGN